MSIEWSVLDAVLCSEGNGRGIEGALEPLDTSGKHNLLVESEVIGTSEHSHSPGSYLSGKSVGHGPESKEKPSGGDLVKVFVLGVVRVKRLAKSYFIFMCQVFGVVDLLEKLGCGVILALHPLLLSIESPSSLIGAAEVVDFLEGLVCLDMSQRLALLIGLVLHKEIRNSFHSLILFL